MVTAQQLHEIMPTLPGGTLETYLPHLQAAMNEFAITSYLREAAFLAQLAEESVELRYMEEIGSGAEYEGRTDLGNFEPGDGPRFKGRGPIQLTGRANYKQYGSWLGIDLVDHPEKAADPSVGFRIAAMYWKLHGLNELADAQDFRAITIRINGGLNGFAEREQYYRRALLVLDRGDSIELPPKVLVNGHLVEAHEWMRNGQTMVAIRPVAEAFGWRIISADGGVVVLQDREKARHSIPMVTRGDSGRGDSGFVAVRDLLPAANVAFKPADRSVELTG